MAIIQSQIPCESLFVEKFEYSFSILIFHEDSISLADVCFHFHKLSPIITNFGVPFSLLVYPNYFEVELTDASPDGTGQLIPGNISTDSLFIIQRTDKSSGEEKLLFENCINPDTMKYKGGLLQFSVLNSFQRGNLRYNDYTYFRSNFGPYAPFANLNDMLRNMFNEYIRCRAITDKSRIRIQYRASDGAGRYDYLLPSQMNAYRLICDAFKADYCGTLHELLLGMLLSFQALLFYKNSGEIYLLPLHDDGSEVFELNGAFITDLELFTRQGIKRSVVGFHQNTYMQDVVEPNYLNAHWCWWSSDPYLGWFEDFKEVTRFTHGNMYYCPFPLDNLDSKYSTDLETVVVQDIYRAGVQCIIPGTAYFLNHNGLYDSGISLRNAFFRTFDRFHMPAAYLKVTLRGLDYPLERLFVLNPDLQMGDGKYRCINYSLDLLRNETVIYGMKVG